MSVLVGALVAGALAIGVTAVSYDEPGDAPAPSDKQIASSVGYYTTDRSVSTYSIDRSVETLARPGPEKDSLTLGTDVLFAYASADLDATARAALTAALGTIPKDARVTIAGHTDHRGGDTVNVPLSRKRAQAVATLVASARPDLHVTTRGYGSAHPLEPETVGGEPDYDAMAHNRRVELTWR